MNRPSRPTRRRDQNGARSSPASPSDQPGKGSSRSVSQRRFWRTLLVVAPSVLAVVLMICIWFIARDARYWRQQQQNASANQLLATQELDSVFQKIWQQIPLDRELGNVDKEMLEVWLRYDLKFVLENGDNPNTRFERATTHRRVGQATFALKRFEEAQEHYTESARLFGELMYENESVYSYRSELADTTVRLAWIMQARQNAPGRDAAIEQALPLLADAPIEPDYLFNTQCAYAYASLGDLSLRCGQPQQADQYMNRCREIFQYLHTNSPENPRYLAELNRLEAKLRVPVSQ